MFSDENCSLFMFMFNQFAINLLICKNSSMQLQAAEVEEEKYFAFTSLQKCHIRNEVKKKFSKYNTRKFLKSRRKLHLVYKFLKLQYINPIKRWRQIYCGQVNKYLRTSYWYAGQMCTFILPETVFLVEKQNLDGKIERKIHWVWTLR